jgi:hypothetical protein
MAEQERDKARELGDRLLLGGDPELIAKRYPKVPELRLREDAPSEEIDSTTAAQDVIGKLTTRSVSAMALRDANGDATAVILPVDRYLELAGKELASHSAKIGTLDGRVLPAEAAFVASYVEQVDPSEEWTHDSTAKNERGTSS